jgi:Skp family chaperone for outer membrane proteins
MNKKIISILTVAFVFGLIAPCFAQAEKAKGASAAAYEHASDEAVFNRVSDWFATVGKNDEEKQAILAERKAKRASEKAKKEAERLQKEAGKEAQKTAEEAKKKQKEMQKGLEEQSQKTKKMFGGK